MAGLIPRAIIYSKGNHLSSLSVGKRGERKENLPQAVPSACVIHLPKEAGMPALPLGIFRIRGDKVLGDVLQKTFAGAAHGTVSESSRFGNSLMSC